MTEHTIQKALANASVMILKPLIKLLLRYGVGYQAFCELAKQAYIDVAKDDFALPGKKQTNSRISTITGLSRKEVTRVLALPKSEQAVVNGPVNRVARVIHGWCSDQHYLTENGEPKDLPFEGELSFSSLVKAYSGDLGAKTIVDELIRMESVLTLPNHLLRLKLKAYVPNQNEHQTLQLLGTDVADLIQTIEHNVLNEQTPYFQRKVSYHNISESCLLQLRDSLSTQAQQHLEALQTTFLNEATTAKKDERPYRVGVGIYYFQAETLERSSCSSES